MSNLTPASLSVIGWREWIGLPDLDIKWIKAKVDTGARSSSLHAIDISTFEKDGQEYVRFLTQPVQRQIEPQVVEASILDWRDVRSSNGKVTKRPVISTNVELLGSTFQVELTLANRQEMGFRMLLGREAVRGRFLVDAGQSYFSNKPKRKRKKN